MKASLCVLLAMAAIALSGGMARGLRADEASTEPAKPAKTGYAPINGLQLYYEIYGPANGKTPLVLLHGGGSTIGTSFGKILPELAKTRQVIAFEQQGHGHTADITERPFGFDQSADDTAALLEYLGVTKADLCGYSNGGTIALYTAVRHPDVVRKLILISSNFSKDGLSPQLLESFKTATAEGMPAELREAYLKVAPHPEQLPLFVQKSVQRMVDFKDLRPEDVRSIQAPTLVLNGDADVILPEHAMKMYRLLPHAQLAILPGTDHMQIVNRVDLLLPTIPPFLDAPIPESSQQK